MIAMPAVRLRAPLWVRLYPYPVAAVILLAGVAAGQIGLGGAAALFAFGVVNFSVNWRAGVTVSDDAITIRRFRDVSIPWRDVKTIDICRRGHMRRLRVVRQSGRDVVCWVPFAVPFRGSTALLQSQVDLVQQRWERSARPTDS